MKKRNRTLLRILAASLATLSLVSCQRFVAPPVQSDEITKIETHTETESQTQAAETTTEESTTQTPPETVTQDMGESGSLGEPTFELTDPEVEIPVLSEATMLADSEEPYNGGKAGCKTLIVPAKYNKGLDYDIRWM